MRISRVKKIFPLLIISFFLLGNLAVAQQLADSLFIYEKPLPHKSISDAPVGVVVIKVCVNRNGDVVSANFEEKGSSTNNENLINVAKENASLYKFDKKENAPFLHCGTIQYDFILKDSLSIDTSDIKIKNK